MKRRIILSMALGLAFCINAFAQETFRVGDDVEYRCNCFGKEWVSATVEAIEGNRIRVRWGNLRNQAAAVTKDLIRAIPKVDSPQTVAFQEAFRAEALNKYIRDLQMLAPFYDDQFNSSGGHTTIAAWQEMTNRLGELDALCKGKYASITNTGTAWLLRQGNIDYRYAEWCKIAANRDALGKLALVAAAKNMISLTVTKDNLQFAFNHQKHRVPDETQMLMYDRAKWKQEQLPKYKPAFADYGIEMPADFSAEVEKRADELKTLIDQTAPNRAWEQPPFRDAAVEAFIKRKYAAEYRGAQVLKAGLDYKIWEVRKGLSYLGSDSTFRYYKVEYNSYKRGWVLMKVPNRPFCQASEWIVGRGAKGMVVVSLGGSGIFVKCE